MGIVYSFIKSLGSKGENEERKEEPHSCSFCASVCKIFKNLWRKIYCTILLAKPRKPGPILPVENHVVLQEISSPSSDSSLDSGQSAAYVPPSDLEWQRIYSDVDIESHVNADTYSPPSDLELQREYSNTENEARIFGGYLNHVEQTFGRIGYDVRGSLNDALRLGFERYTCEVRGRPLSGYIDILEELRHLSVLRSEWLRQMLAILDMQR
ncbi:Hypothetical predicted protein [Olea europaea subsp. europaea]|uniref:Uncharacterized protein n=1 Tax=Olea europaea subsp. europaea TaxID=158383 RepID=A0A8S0R628_OLEEU|nr:Hypothetical predicted protein [Olea europaea subsp. europaea]